MSDMIEPKNLNQLEYITIVDKNYTYVSVSKSYLETKQIQPKDIINKKISDIWKDVVVQNQILGNINQALSGKEVSFRGKFTFGKEKMWYRVKYIPLIENDGSVEKIVISTLNISTEIKSINNIINTLRKDKLTKIHNRRSFDEDIKKINRKQKMYTLMLLDLDKFKQINDKFGHQAGDLALQECSKIFRQLLKPDGRLYRIGGDEFCAISKNTNKKSIEKIAKTIIQKLKVADFNKIFGIGVSIGIIFVKNPSKISWKDQMRIVDENMYASKSNGKNTYTFSEI